MSEVKPRSVYREEFRRYGRLPAYGFAGIVVLLALFLISFLSVMGIRGPSTLQAEFALWFLGFSVWVLAAGLVYLLFSLRRTLRLVRYQATEVAILRSQQALIGRAVPLPPPFSAGDESPRSKQVEPVAKPGHEYQQRPERQRPGTATHRPASP